MLPQTWVIKPTMEPSCFTINGERPSRRSGATRGECIALCHLSPRGKNLEKDVMAYDKAIDNCEKQGKELKDLKSAEAEDQKKLASVTNQLKELQKK
uniref:DUF1090 domain-containing protein n=1 Tax=Steinernema glaseri TaxID=37863 RepID=A0A1I7YRC4_9BILA